MYNIIRFTASKMPYAHSFLNYRRSPVLFLFFFLIPIITFSSCPFEADRNNLWDPGSPNYIGYDLVLTSADITVMQDTEEILINDGVYDFGNLSVGESSPAVAFTIRNDGEGDLSIESITWTEENITEFILNIDSISYTLTPGNETSFTITYSPASAGDKSAILSIVNNDPDEGAYNFSVTGTGTASKSWGSPEMISSGSYEAHEPQVDMDNNGNAIAIWCEDQAPRRVFAKRYDGSSWSGSIRLDNQNYSAYKLQITINSDGNAIAAWYQEDSSVNRERIFVNHYLHTGDSWLSIPNVISDSSVESYDSQVSMNNSGYAVAVWRASGNVYANDYRAGSWQQVEIGELICNGTSSVSMKVAIDADSNAIAVWNDDQGATSPLYSCRYIGSTGDWNSAVGIGEGYKSYNAQIAMNDNGIAVAVWDYEDETNYNVGAKIYNSSWSNMYTIDSGYDHTANLYPKVAIDQSGNAIAVWKQYDGSTFRIYTNRYTFSNSSWGSAQIIDTGQFSSPEQASDPHVAMDGEGNAIAVWCEEKLAATNSIYARRYNVSSDQWQDAQEIDNLDGGAMSPIIAMDSNGNGTVLWRQFYNTRYNIFTVRYE